ncbi:MAG: hypothetical protein J0L86_10640 [Flavobacteriales bacterium]|nr:hypothetical protein [Flavobacteriales bacterium]
MNFSNRKKLVVASTILFINFLFTSCGAIVKSAAVKEMTVEKNAIPADFGAGNTTLICVLKGRNSRDNYMRKHIKNIYKGKYEFVLESDLNSSKYSDKNTYRFLFDYDAGSTSSVGHNNVTGRTEAMSLPTSSYYIKDRKNDKIYHSNFSSGFFSKLIQAYVINMEKVRLQNQ